MSLARSAQRRSKIVRLAVLVLLVASLFVYWKFPRTASITIDPQRVSFVVSPSFLGISSDWGETRGMMGIPSTGNNPIYRQLIKNLYETSGGSLSIRIGGNTADQKEYNGEPNAEEISAFAQIQKDLRADFYLSVNRSEEHTS